MNNEQPAAPAAPPEELSILQTMKALREGEFISELDDLVQEAIDTASELGRPAAVTITLSIVPAGRTVVISDDIKPKIPQPVRDATVFYLGVGNKLTRKDPKQAVFPADVGFTGRASVQ